MKADSKTIRGKTSTQVGSTELRAVIPNTDDAPRARRSRSKVDPTRRHGALIISDNARQALENCELFQGLDRQQLMAVAALVEEHSVEPNEKLIGEGETAQYLYVVVEGRGIAKIELERGWLSLGLVGPSEAAGWSSLIDGQVYPATVVALTAMRVVRIEASGLVLLMNVEPKIGYPIHRSLSSIFYRQYDAALKAFKTA